MSNPSLPQETQDGIPSLWTPRESVREILEYLKNGIAQPYRMLYDLTAIDERARTRRPEQPWSDFTVVYHLLSLDRNAYIRVKTALRQDDLSLDTITPIRPSANWYEREVWDMCGIAFSGHPRLTRLLMPKTWRGHPLQKDLIISASPVECFDLANTRGKSNPSQQCHRSRCNVSDVKPN